MTASTWTAAAAPSARPRGLRPVRVLHVALLLMVVGNLGRVPLLSGGSGKEAPLLVNELALVAVLGVAALACLQARALRLDGVALAGLAFAFVGATSAVLAVPQFNLTGFELAFSLAYVVRWTAYLGIYVATINVARDDDAEPLWRTLERAVLLFAAFGIVQSIFLPGFAQMVYPEDDSTMAWDRQGHRLVSTLLDPNFAGALILIPLLVQVARLSYGVRVARWKPLLLLAALLMTVSRSTVLALAVGGLVILVARGLNRRVLRFAAVVTAVAIPFLPLLASFAASFNKFSVDGSAMARAVAWLRALTVFADHPVVGIGFNTYGYVQKAYGWDAQGGESFALDGGLLFIAVMTGVVGLAVYAVMLALAFRRSRRLWRDDRADAPARGTALGVAAATAALVVHSVFVNSLLLPFVMEPLWVLWALVFLHARRVARARAAEPPPARLAA